jgi:hypothetical protein
MKTIVVIFALLLSNSSAFAADDVTPETTAANAIGKAVLGNEFVEGVMKDVTLHGNNGCDVSIFIRSSEIDGVQYVDSFDLTAGPKNEQVELQLGRVSNILKQTTADGVESVTYDSVGLCTGGLFPGSASCDKFTNKISVRRDNAGKVLEVVVKSKLHKFFQRTQVAKCQF